MQMKVSVLTQPVSVRDCVTCAFCSWQVRSVRRWDCIAIVRSC